MNLPREVLDLMDKLDATTYNHSYRLWQLALEVENYFHDSDDSLSSAAFIHDIGKIYIPASILDKREGLNSLEREIVNYHAYYGYRILDDYKVDEKIKRIVLWHHSFNPSVLESVPDYYSIETADKAQMLHTLDVFEALTTDRPYKRRMSVSQAVAQMEKEPEYHREILKFLIRNTTDF